ncbi:serine hydrolase domain-containing protein [Streptomyces sp. NPDC059447]|uniref:serine hydrolase domain-containing protein n=1 Tax=Streptomyces sp. NPDC059447 TaxID=3346834 RepID=UPI00369E1485
MKRTRTVLLCIAGLLGAALPAATVAGPASGPASAAAAPEACATSPGPARGDAAKVLAIAQKAKQEFGLNSVVLRVSSGGKDVLTTALGESMTGVPAEPSMHFRTGSVGIVYMGIALLRLVEQGKASLDDPVSRWLPDLPHGDEITLRMLGSSTSGLHDYVTDPAFLAELESHPFRHWTTDQITGYATSKPLLYQPGTNWSYSHANFALLGTALEKISGVGLERLLTEQIMNPLGLSQTTNQYTPRIPEPALHAFTSERGKYEESTFWNPSWTTAPGAVLVQNICDLDRSARGVGTGELLSAQSFKTQLDPGTIGLGHATATCPATVCLLTNTEAQHFGLGVIVLNGWTLTNPSFSGYAAVSAYLPAEKLAISVTVTQGPKSPAGNSAQPIAERISDALAPGHSLKMR